MSFLNSVDWSIGLLIKIYIKNVSQNWVLKDIFTKSLFKILKNLNIYGDNSKCKQCSGGRSCSHLTLFFKIHKHKTAMSLFLANLLSKKGSTKCKGHFIYPSQKQTHRQSLKFLFGILSFEIMDVMVRVANVVAHHDELLTQWRYIWMRKLGTNIFLISTTSNYLRSSAVCKNQHF